MQKHYDLILNQLAVNNKKEEETVNPLRHCITQALKEKRLETQYLKQIRDERARS